MRLREDLKAAKAKFKKSEEKHAKSAGQAEELREATAAMEKEVPQLEQRRAAAEQQLEKEEAKLDGMLAGLKSELEVLGAQLAKVQEELAPWEQRISEASARVDVAAAERSLLVGKREGAHERLREAREGAEKAVTDAAAREAEAKRAQKEAAAKQKEAAAARKEEAAAKDREAELRSGVQAARGRAEELRHTAREEQSQSGLLAALMQAKSKGQIPGIQGRLGDLGAIDAKYDIAVSMAGGGALDHIVVETTADAQKCVELLRKNALGVATFLILEKQAGLEQECRQQVEAPEGVPRLIDLVRPASDRLRVAFYYALRNTTVAKDIDHASRIAYGSDKRFRRVVTLDGAAARPARLTLTRLSENVRGASPDIREPTIPCRQASSSSPPAPCPAAGLRRRVVRLRARTEHYCVCPPSLREPWLPLSDGPPPRRARPHARRQQRTAGRGEHRRPPEGPRGRREGA